MSNAPITSHAAGDRARGDLRTCSIPVAAIAATAAAPGMPALAVSRGTNQLLWLLNRPLDDFQPLSRKIWFRRSEHQEARQLRKPAARFRDRCWVEWIHRWSPATGGSGKDQTAHKPWAANEQ